MNKQILSILLILPVFLIIGGCSQSGSVNKTADSFVVDQTDKETASMALPGSFVGTNGKIDFKAKIKVVSKGQNSTAIANGAKYDYLNQWEIAYVYDEIWDQLSIDAGAMGQCAISKNEIQYKAKLKFDLSTIDQDGNFTVKVENPSAKIDKLYMVCITKFGTQTIPAEGLSANYSSIFAKGKITNMTKDGATLTFSDSYVYNSGYYKTISKPIILKIKRK